MAGTGNGCSAAGKHGRAIAIAGAADILLGPPRRAIGRVTAGAAASGEQGDSSGDGDGGDAGGDGGETGALLAGRR